MRPFASWCRLFGVLFWVDLPLVRDRSEELKSLIHMASVLAFLADRQRTAAVASDPVLAGARPLAVPGTGSNLVQDAVRHAPDLVVADLLPPGDAWMESLESLGSVASGISMSARRLGTTHHSVAQGINGLNLLPASALRHHAHHNVATAEGL